jgi:hypothetical protein
MNYDEIDALLKEYNWILESYSPLNIRSKDGEHFASNFAAEVVIEWFAFVDAGNDDDEKEELKQRFKLIEQIKKDDGQI